jgi:hypothetical protein
MYNNCHFRCTRFTRRGLIARIAHRLRNAGFLPEKIDIAGRAWGAVSINRAEISDPLFRAKQEAYERSRL